MCVHTVTRERAGMVLAARHDGYDALGARDLTDALQLVVQHGPPAAILVGDMPARTRKTFLAARDKDVRLAHAPLVYISARLLQAWLGARDVGPPDVEALRTSLADARKRFSQA